MRNIIIILLASLAYISAFSVTLASADQPKIVDVEVVDEMDETVPEEPKDECFIATAAYGSKYDLPVKILRQFRDEYLLTHKLGKTFVDFYYENSPPIANYIAGNEILKFIVKIMLIPAVIISYLFLHPFLIIFLGGIGLLVVQNRLSKNFSAI